MSKIVMALDQGTTSSRTILFSEKGEIVADANAPLACDYPQPAGNLEKPVSNYSGGIEESSADNEGHCCSGNYKPA